MKSGAIVLTALGMAVAGLALPGTPAAPAEAEGPVLHTVRYTVGASQDTRVNIYYRDVEPPNWADYSHNPYLYSPKAAVDLGPGKPWVLEAQLADPDSWAMVVASLPGHTPEPAAPGFVCELRVDDVVVATDVGTRGALCSLRTW